MLRSPFAFRPAFALVLSCTLVFGCSLLKKKNKKDAEEDPPVANAEAVTVTGTGAKNEKDVLRYAKETKLADEPGIISKEGTVARAFPVTGGNVAALPVGTPVVKIAKYFSTGVLVTFDDPTGDGTKLMGWIPPEALAAPTAAIATATTAPIAPVPRTPVDAGAKAADGGAPTADAGAAGAADAGAKLDAGPAATADAGAAPGQTPAASLLQTLPVAGKCPAGFAIVGPFCRRPCTADTQCPKGTFCTAAAGRKTCSATR